MRIKPPLLIYRPEEPKDKTKPPKIKVHYDSHVGIYKIHCIDSNRVYIGQSKNVPNRIRSHRCALKSGKYSSKTKGLNLMQQDYDKYGEDAFVMLQLLECTEQDLLEEETRALSEFIAAGIDVYNHFVNTNTSGIICPEDFKPLVERVIKLLDRGKLSVSELDSALDSIENSR